jgi:hypothetical protein
LTTCGAITLQGPHQVAKQSRTMRVPFSFMAESKSALDCRLCTPSLPIFAVLLKALLGLRLGVVLMLARVSVRSGEVVVVRDLLVTKRVVVSKAVRLIVFAAKDIQKVL